MKFRCTMFFSTSHLVMMGGLGFGFSASKAYSFDVISDEIEIYAQDPRGYMSRPPVKRTPSGRMLEKTLPEAGDWLETRDHFRKKIIQQALPAVGRIPSGVDKEQDNPASFLSSGSLINKLSQMEEQDLTHGSLKKTPWSGDYWPIYRGNIAARYEDPFFPRDPNWQVNFDYVQSHPVMEIMASGNWQQINNLAPSEKYNLVLGDSAEHLTQALWKEGEFYFRYTGSVERWFGICHGWAAASFMLARPVLPVKIKLPNENQDIVFYPSDTKALASLLWASSPAPTRYVGGRCNDKNPPTDEHGRITSSDCFDNNPATWHKVVVGEVGKMGRSMIMDASYDYEVWNQPLVEYRYRYFNPETRKEAKNWQMAAVDLERWQNDRFHSYRHSLARSVVGIAMEVTYAIETAARHEEENGPQNDATRTVVYLYDLELDEQQNIIGGEWYQNLHADFIWAPKPGARAITDLERTLRQAWREGEAVPTSWLEVGQKLGSRGQVLAGFVEELIRRAQHP